MMTVTDMSDIEVSDNCVRTRNVKHWHILILENTEGIDSCSLHCVGYYYLKFKYSLKVCTAVLKHVFRTDGYVKK